jgi:hypothetical protein
MSVFRPIEITCSSPDLISFLTDRGDTAVG